MIDLEEKNLQPEVYQQTSTDLVRDLPNMPESPNDVKLDVAVRTALIDSHYMCTGASGTFSPSVIYYFNLCKSVPEANVYKMW